MATDATDEEASKIVLNISTEKLKIMYVSFTAKTQKITLRSCS